MKPFTIPEQLLFEAVLDHLERPARAVLRDQLSAVHYLRRDLPGQVFVPQRRWFRANWSARLFPYQGPLEKVFSVAVPQENGILRGNLWFSEGHLASFSYYSTRGHTNRAQVVTYADLEQADGALPPPARSTREEVARRLGGGTAPVRAAYPDRIVSSAIEAEDLHHAPPRWLDLLRVADGFVRGELRLRGLHELQSIVVDDETVHLLIEGGQRYVVGVKKSGTEGVLTRYYFEHEEVVVEHGDIVQEWKDYE